MVRDRPARQQGPGAAVLNLRAMQTPVPSDRDKGDETVESAAADRLGGRQAFDDRLSRAIAECGDPDGHRATQ